MTFQELTDALKNAQVKVLVKCDESQEIVLRSNFTGKMKVVKVLGEDVDSSGCEIFFDRCDVFNAKVDLFLGNEYQVSI